MHLNHGGTEMGQGLYIKVAQVVADELGVPVDRVRVNAAADTSKVPNASATAASSGSDINGKAAQIAAGKIRNRLTAFAARHFSVSEADVDIAGGIVRIGDRKLKFVELVQLAWFDRESRFQPPASTRPRRSTTTARRSAADRFSTSHTALPSARSLSIR